MTQIQIKSDFGSGQVVTEEAAKMAAECVVRNAKSTEEALFFLDLLGLIPPQMPIVELKKARLTPEAKEARLKARIEREEREKAKMREFNVQPHEIGE